MTLFAREYRGSGILLHVTSLPSPYGIGDIGPAAIDWIDRLAAAGQSWWQSLPLGPTGYANSPYQSLSSFAANWLLISPEWLVEDGLLQKEDCEVALSRDFVDYPAVGAFKRKLLEKAWLNFNATSSLQPAYEEFRQTQKHWLDDYALFRALKEAHGGAHYLSWNADLVDRKPDALANAGRELKTQVDQACLAQFLLFRQGDRLRKYARAQGIRLIGDLPFFVSPDSSDVWANTDLFLLDEKRRPRFVAGVPPDYFSATGQLWGNPVYDWSVLCPDGYRWWLDRMKSLLAHVDVIRLDHFRGFVASWRVVAGASTAKIGEWVAGPAADFFKAAEREFGTLPFIAEDLGLITPDVTAVRERFDLPGTRVLQFGFNGDAQNPHLPDNYAYNSVAYTGTHDNNTSRGWFDELPADQRCNFWRYLKRSAGSSAEVAAEMIRLAWSSPAALAITPLQDLLNLGAEARMNLPGRSDGNWRWRCTQEMLSESEFEWLHKLTDSAGRLRQA